MSGPQLEHGYLRIANELFVAIIMARFTARERGIIDVVIRQTYGWQKKESLILSSTFQELTGMGKSEFFRVRAKLIKRRVIFFDDGVYQINKKYSEWLHGMPVDKPVDNLLKTSSRMNTLVAKTHYDKWQKPTKTSGKNPLPLLVKDNKDNIKTTSAKGASHQPVDNSKKGASPHSEECLDLMAQVYKKGLNIYQLENRLKKELKPRGGKFPEQVVMMVCRHYLSYKGTIKKEWPWFVRVFKDQASQYWANLCQEEHKKVKDQPSAICDIIAQIAKMKGVA